MSKIKIKLPKQNHIPYVETEVIDRHNNPYKMYIHGYLVGLEAAFQLKKKNEFHNLVIVTGDVGTGKSTFIEGMAGFNAYNSGKNLSFENVAWATYKFIEYTDNENNVGCPLWWDESIQGATGRIMAITALGNKLKIAFVTKRFKKHTYYLAIDEINEYAWKLIKMADCWIHIKKIGLNRGYFNAFTHKNKIKFLYNAFKFFNKTWSSPEVRKVLPDCKGKFDNWNGLFLDPIEYNRLKLEETKQIEDNQNINWRKEKVKAFALWFRGGMTQKEIAKEIDTPRSTVASWVEDFKNVVGQE